MSKEIETNVDAILEAAGVTYSAINRGVKINALGGDVDMDMWVCTFTNAKRPNEPQEFDFYTGFGLRAPATEADRRKVSGFHGLTEKDKKGITLYGRRYLAEVEKHRKPVAPCAASVLHSLVLDSDAVAQSFAHWCSDFGYDTDSRKAFATYEECQVNSDKLRLVFDRATINKLREALEDY